VIGLDNLNNYYDVKLKLGRLEAAGIEGQKVAYNEPVVSKNSLNYTFIQLGIEDAANLERLFVREQFDKVCHLAAQAGVRYSIKHPEAYLQSNIVGFFNILEACRHNKVAHLVYASSSSVYGANKNVPYSVKDNVDNPISFYAATKKSNELMAHTYSHLYDIQTTGLRFFTVYGPWGRPDMAAFLFTKAILDSEPIKVFNEGNMSRDFTYIDDVVEGVSKVLNQKKEGKAKDSFKIYNVGNNSPTQLLDFISAIENALGKTAEKQLMPMQEGDMQTTYADITTLKNDFNYQPQTSLNTGIQAFVDWYQGYYSK
jgi:UDP-glucuronate 4-epimerase